MGISRILRRGGKPGHCIFRLTFGGVFNIFSMASQTLNRCREVTTQIERVQGSGRMAETMAPALVDFLNP
jgi:hypothetical protein